MKHFVIAASLLALLPVSQAVMAHTATAHAADAAPASPLSFNAVALNYAALVEASYADTLATAKTMQQAINAFTKSPSGDTLAQARKAWLAAREFYGQTEAFRFYSGPIDDAKGPEGRINAWPMDESYVDGTKTRPDGGLINKRSFVISKKSLSAQNERGGEENIATGWHAIEFLLWGQDLSETGPGDRSFEDFVDGKKPNADRRRRYLDRVTELLIDDLGSVAQAWAPGVKTNYRAKFEKGGQDSVRKILLGLGSLSRGELAGERLEVALNSQDQEDEHSCFSDNTHRDVVNNARGIQNVWLGEYRRADGRLLRGASLRDLVTAKDASLAAQASLQILGTVMTAEAIRAPFDREIVGAKDAAGRLRIQKTIASLTQQSKDLAAAAKALGITRLAFDAPQK